jgi:hypothetical protein
MNAVARGLGCNYVMMNTSGPDCVPSDDLADRLFANVDAQWSTSELETTGTAVLLSIAKTSRE